MEDMSPFGVVLDKEMKSKGISKTELGSRLAVSPSTVTQYFRSAPSLDTIFRIAKAIDVDGWQLVAATETGSPIQYFKLVSEITKLPKEKQVQFLEGLKPIIELAKGDVKK